jgi:hypothetical protein
MERKAVSQRASRPFGVPQLSMKQGPRQPVVSRVFSGYVEVVGVDGRKRMASIQSMEGR